MSKQKWGLKSPEKFAFATSTAVAEKFRKHCAMNQYLHSRVLEDLVIDYLIQEKVIESREALDIETQMSN